MSDANTEVMSGTPFATPQNMLDLVSERTSKKDVQFRRNSRDNIFSHLRMSEPPRKTFNFRGNSRDTILSDLGLSGHP